MNSESELSRSEIQKLADEIVFQVTGIHLSDVETKVLQGASEGKTYDKIGEELGFSGSYLNKDVGNPLWKKLSDGLGEEVGKKNFKQALKRKALHLVLMAGLCGNGKEFVQLDY